MNMFTRGLRSLVCGVVAATAAASFTVAQAAWPDDRPIHVIVPYGAGGTPDIFTRMIADELSKRLGQTFVVENRPGAGGNIGTQRLAMASPDGYLLGYANNATLATNQFLFANMPYDPVQLTSILALFYTPNVLVVAADSPIQNVTDLIAYGTRNPEQFNFASTGVGTSSHLGGALFNALAKVSAQHVPYQASPEAMRDVAAGRVQFMFVNLPPALPMVESGRLRVIAITTRERWSLYPDVPTMAQAGLPGYEMVSWGGLVGPPGMPDAIVQRLVQVSNAILQDVQVKDRMDKLMFTALGGDAPSFVQMQVAEREKWRDLIKQTGASVN